MNHDAYHATYVIFDPKELCQLPKSVYKTMTGNKISCLLPKRIAMACCGKGIVTKA